MNKKLVIVGAGGHGRVARDLAVLCGYENIIFLDDFNREDLSVSGSISDFSLYVNDCVFFVAIGNNDVREKLTKTLVAGGAEIVSLIHPSSCVGGNVSIGKGSILMAGTVVNNGAKIGNGVIINTSSSADHDDILEDFCHLAVGVHLAGNVKIGKGALVGAGATIINNVSICDNCIVGAGAVVVKNLTNRGTYVGVPAKKIKD